MSCKKRLIYTGVTAVTVLGATILLVQCYRWHSAEIVWDLQNPQRISAVRSIALTSKPLFEALHRFHHDHYRYPTSIDQLYPLYLTPVPEDTGIPYRWQGWAYWLDDGSSYRLEHLLNWSDQDISYASPERGKPGAWVYDNGGGHLTELPELGDIREP